MGIFNQILQAIDDPQCEASPEQLGNIINTVQQLSNNYQANPTAINSAISIVGKYARSALQEKRNHEGEAQVQQIITQFGGTQANNQGVKILFSTPQIQKIVKEIETKTGLNPGTIESMLPMLVPIVLDFLKTGTNPDKPLTNNPVLNSFLDADGDGDVDISDGLQMVSKYLK